MSCKLEELRKELYASAKDGMYYGLPVEIAEMRLTAAVTSMQVVKIQSSKAVQKKMDVITAKVKANEEAKLARILGEAETPSTGKRPSGSFKGFVGGFEDKGKGTPEGDGKDKAMRKVANTSIVELADRTKPSSSKTTETQLPWDSNLAIHGTVMLARNGELAGQALDPQTKKRINEAHERGAMFVVGDMPDVDSQFIDYLNEIGASYQIYHTGSKVRITQDGKRSKPAAQVKEKFVEGDLFKHRGPDKVIVVTTNLGGVHGAGTAAQAQKAGLISAKKNREFKESPIDKNVLTVAVKGREPSSVKDGVTTKGDPLTIAWAEQVIGENVELLKEQMRLVYKYATTNPHVTVSIPFVGLGHGEGNINDIAPILGKLLDLPNVQLVIPSKEVLARSKKATVRTDDTNAEHADWIAEIKKHMSVDATTSKATPAGSTSKVSENGILVKDARGLIQFKNINGSMSTSRDIKTMNDMIELAEEYESLMIADEKAAERDIAYVSKMFRMLERSNIPFSKVNVKFVDVAPSGSVDIKGLAKDSKTITMYFGNTHNASPAQVLLHEYVHTITQVGLQKNQELQAKVAKLMAHVHKHVTKEQQAMYGMTNAKEFLAEAIAEPAFQEMLRKIPPMENKGVLAAIKEMFKELLDSLTNSQLKEVNALTEALELVIKAAEVQADTQQTAAGKVAPGKLPSTAKPGTTAVVPKNTNTGVFVKDQDTYYTKKMEIPRTLRIPDNGSMDKDMRRTRNILVGLFNKIESDLSFGNGEEDIKDTYSAYLTPELLQILHDKSELDSQMRKPRTIDDWEAFKNKYLGAKNTRRELYEKVRQTNNLPEFVESDLVSGYEFSFPASLLLGTTSTYKDSPLPTKGEVKLSSNIIQTIKDMEEC